MKRKRFSVKQITATLKQAELGTPIADLLRQHGISEQSYSRMDPSIELRQRVRELAHARVRFGYRQIYMLLKREGWDFGKDRFYRVYCEENLSLRRKRPWRHVSAVHREQKRPAGQPNEV